LNRDLLPAETARSLKGGNPMTFTTRNHL